MKTKAFPSSSFISFKLQAKRESAQYLKISRSSNKTIIFDAGQIGFTCLLPLSA